LVCLAASGSGDLEELDADLYTEDGVSDCVRLGIAELSLGLFLDIDVEVEAEAVCPVKSGDCILSAWFLLAFETVTFCLRLVCRMGFLGCAGEGAGEM
jgi:hypothetical protein